LGGSSLVAVPGSALFVGGSHAVGAGCADGVAVVVMFVVGGDVADLFVQVDAFAVGGEDRSVTLRQ